MSKLIIYQMLPRLFGNNNEHPQYNGRIDQNGCGKLNDITPAVLRKLKDLGTTHVWYTGLLEHATCTDYSDHGIRCDHQAVVKGKAGSPYAIKDYYDIDPDLASKPELRFQEFKNLLKRTHQAGLGFVMDFVPNHVARQYHSDARPEGVRDLGEDDCTTQAFSPQNNFYYIPGHSLHCQFDMKGDAMQPYQEEPARVTGNDCFTASPGRNDWYETIKLNYGVDYVGGRVCRFNPIPDTWHKMLHILLFWASQGVDAFRCDMAEMVPCEFWNWALTEVKRQYPDVLFIAEVYNPSLYREYIFKGHFDYLYDKVGLYDILRAVTRYERPASDISNCWKNVGDIQQYMLNFLENHDEQRLASDFYAGNGHCGKAALLVSACINTNPFMIHFGQELGERGMEQEGFSGRDGRTTIFDYWNVPTLLAWHKNGKYLKSNLPAESRSLYDFYLKVMKAATTEAAISRGSFYDVMYANYHHAGFDTQRYYSFLRKADDEVILVVANFSRELQQAEVVLPQHAFDFLQLPEGETEAVDLLTGKRQMLNLAGDRAVSVEMEPYGGVMLKFKAGIDE